MSNHKASDQAHKSSVAWRLFYPPWQNLIRNEAAARRIVGSFERSGFKKPFFNPDFYRETTVHLSAAWVALLPFVLWWNPKLATDGTETLIGQCVDARLDASSGWSATVAIPCIYSLGIAIWVVFVATIIILFLVGNIFFGKGHILSHAMPRAFDRVMPVDFPLFLFSRLLHCMSVAIMAIFALGLLALVGGIVFVTVNAMLFDIDSALRNVKSTMLAFTLIDLISDLRVDVLRVVSALAIVLSLMLLAVELIYSFSFIRKSETDRDWDVLFFILTVGTVPGLLLPVVAVLSAWGYLVFRNYNRLLIMLSENAEMHVELLWFLTSALAPLSLIVLITKSYKKLLGHTSG